ncbi:DUF6734 family protein [Flavobacterium branchiicola]|uniref:DUF6734 family protein n=1 Tax=Flavobacterium branchiicola TaxID=1114875 RepID=A0ABV9PA35_9FLAO|nr:DUF6734 family protein [Flavobacterium branchiicola]MBS7252939.1 hypothetical protein [Flavobacterium branchiicola]
MKIIQSFWSKPFFKENDDLNARFKGGWLNANFFFYSCLLSCLKFKQNYGEVLLYTDDLGKELLIDKLEIPYSKVQLDLNSLQNYPPELWALGKILSYSLQEAPFIHADTDVFVWDKLPQPLLDADLLAQNFEFNFPKYKEVLETALKEFQNFPRNLFSIYEQTNDVFAFNAGIIGGNNVSFFKEYKSKVFQIIDDNLDQLSKIDLGVFNMVYEQMLGFELAQEKQIEIRFLKPKMNEAFTNVMKFHLVPIKENYIHTVGYAKKSTEMCEQLKYRLKYEFPLEYEKLNRNLVENNLSSESEIFDDEERFDFLSKIYAWMENTCWDTILETPFQLSKTTRLNEISEDEIELYYYSPQHKTEQKLEMEDWDFLLLFFREQNTINQIILEISKDESFMQSISVEELKEKVFSFVMDRCIYHEILLPLNIV